MKKNLCEKKNEIYICTAKKDRQMKKCIYFTKCNFKKFKSCTFSGKDENIIVCFSIKAWREIEAKI